MITSDIGLSDIQAKFLFFSVYHIFYLEIGKVRRNTLAATLVDSLLFTERLNFFVDEILRVFLEFTMF